MTTETKPDPIETALDLCAYHVRRANIRASRESDEKTIDRARAVNLERVAELAGLRAQVGKLNDHIRGMIGGGDCK